MKVFADFPRPRVSQNVRGIEVIRPEIIAFAERAARLSMTGRFYLETRVTQLFEAGHLGGSVSRTNIYLSPRLVPHPPNHIRRAGIFLEPLPRNVRRHEHRRLHRGTPCRSEPIGAKSSESSRCSPTRESVHQDSAPRSRHRLT